MTKQLSLFDALRRPPVQMAVDADGLVLQTEPHFTFRLPHPRYAWERAEIEVHQHEGGLWMWSTSHNADMGGGGYRVGAKWGNFAETREDALFYACVELERKLEGKVTSDVLMIQKWVANLKDNAEVFE